MNFREILTPERTVNNIKNVTKKSAFELIAKLAAEKSDEINSKEVVEALYNREKLGSTVIGQGVAIPHARIGGIEQPIGILLHLNDAISFDISHPQVDLLFALLVPENSEQQHLEILASIAKSFSHTTFCKQLRQSQSNTELYQNAMTDLETVK